MFYHRKNPACGSSAGCSPLILPQSLLRTQKPALGLGLTCVDIRSQGSICLLGDQCPDPRPCEDQRTEMLMFLSSPAEVMNGRCRRGWGHAVLLATSASVSTWRTGADEQNRIAARPPPGPVPKAQPASSCGLGPRKAGGTVNFNKLTELLRTKSQITWSLRAAVIAWEFKGSCRSPRVWRHRQRGTRAQSGRGGTPTGASPLPQCRLPPSVHSRILNSSTT